MAMYTEQPEESAISPIPGCPHSPYFSLFLLSLLLVTCTSDVLNLALQFLTSTSLFYLWQEAWGQHPTKIQRLAKTSACCVSRKHPLQNSFFLPIHMLSAAIFSHRSAAHFLLSNISIPFLTESAPNQVQRNTTEKKKHKKNPNADSDLIFPLRALRLIKEGNGR